MVERIDDMPGQSASGLGKRAATTTWRFWERRWTEAAESVDNHGSSAADLFPGTRAGCWVDDVKTGLGLGSGTLAGALGDRHRRRVDLRGQGLPALRPDPPPGARGWRSSPSRSAGGSKELGRGCRRAKLTGEDVKVAAPASNLPSVLLHPPSLFSAAGCPLPNDTQTHL